MDGLYHLVYNEKRRAQHGRSTCTKCNKSHSLSVRLHISKITCPNLTKLSVGLHVMWPWLGRLLTAMQYIMYFRFVDDVMFSHNGTVPSGIKAGRLATDWTFWTTLLNCWLLWRSLEPRRFNEQVSSQHERNTVVTGCWRC